MKEHIAAVHEGQKHFQCSTCDANFTKKPELKEHIDAVHEGQRYWKWNGIYQMLITCSVSTSTNFSAIVSISSVIFVVLALQEDINQQLMKERSRLTARFVLLALQDLDTRWDT